MYILKNIKIYVYLGTENRDKEQIYNLFVIGISAQTENRTHKPSAVRSSDNSTTKLVHKFIIVYYKNTNTL